jgi:predicted membrane channel-forming protein YqfA (hemolysin III family)
VWLAILLCLVGVIVPAILFGISEKLVMWAFAACLSGVVIGIIVNAFRKTKDSK